MTGSTEEVDLVVAGAGAGGMTAALAAALRGLKVLLCEASDQVGGTTATSAGTIWVPGNRQGRAAGFDDSIDKGRAYLDAILGEDIRGLRRAYLDSADEAIHWLESKSEVRFTSAGQHPDYIDLPGAARAGRALMPVEFDGRRLGRDFDRIRPPLQDFMVLGGMMANKADVQALIHRFRSVRHFAKTMRLVSRYGIDRLRFRRGTRLVLGNGLVARLYASLLNAGVPIRFGARLQDLHVDAGRVRGAAVAVDGKTVHVRARVGVALATGGFGHDGLLRSELGPCDAPLRSLAFEGDRGDGIAAARRASALLERHAHSFFWQPVSEVPDHSSRSRLFPHLYLDRAKPGVIAVNQSGARFVNEGASYHHFVEAMLRSNRTTTTVPAWLVCDARFVRAYGLGVIAPGTTDLKRYERSGYIALAPSLAMLAGKVGIDPAGLAASVERNNAFARTGYDADFGKGSTEVSRFNGDPAHRPNPCLGPIAEAPFCALALWPADSATSTGLATDADGRVLDEHGNLMPGLYACGNDMASIMRGTYPGPGITIGPAMVFGCRIAMHARREADAMATDSTRFSA
jgi:succinate dehydrogenase/fumarate reductase flavoprotein subunit